MDTSYDNLKKFISKYVELNNVQWHFLKQFIQISHFKKNDIIQFPGTIPEKIMFLNNGIARSFIVDINGNDYTWEFHFNDENATAIHLFPADYQSFLEQKESPMTIEALEECKVMWISYTKLQLLYKFSKKFERFGRLALEEGFCYLQQRFINLSIQSAQERYEEYIEQHEYILDKVPQYHVATYLKITPQHLSKIKKELKK